MEIQRIWEAEELTSFSKEVASVIYKTTQRWEYILWGNGKYYATFCEDTGETLTLLNGNLELLEYIKELIEMDYEYVAEEKISELDTDLVIIEKALNK